MKYVSAIMLTLGTAAGLLSASATSSVENQEVAMNNNPAPQVAKVQSVQDPNSAIKIIAPHNDLENAIRASEKGDILILGSDGWYRVEGKTLQQGTRVYVLSKAGSPVAVFPKEAETVR
jgi:hypothetical protein